MFLFVDLLLTRHHTHRQILDGVYLHEDLQNARQRLDGLRRMQRSRVYAHPSAALRNQINTTRGESKRNHTFLEKKLASRHRKLSQLPDAGRLVMNIETEWHASNQALQGYLDGVEMWLEAVEPQTRTLITELQEQAQARETERQNK